MTKGWLRSWLREAGEQQGGREAGEQQAPRMYTYGHAVICRCTQAIMHTVKGSKGGVEGTRGCLERMAPHIARTPESRTPLLQPLLVHRIPHERLPQAAWRPASPCSPGPKH